MKSTSKMFIPSHRASYIWFIIGIRVLEVMIVYQESCGMFSSCSMIAENHFKKPYRGNHG